MVIYKIVLNDQTMPALDLYENNPFRSISARQIDGVQKELKNLSKSGFSSLIDAEVIITEISESTPGTMFLTLETNLDNILKQELKKKEEDILRTDDERFIIKFPFRIDINKIPILLGCCDDPKFSLGELSDISGFEYSRPSETYMTLAYLVACEE